MAEEISIDEEFARAMGADSRKPVLICKFPRLLPLLPKLGIFVTQDRCDRPRGHAGMHSTYWRS